MLRYELRSNAASSEQGLHRFPALDDFAQTLAAQQVELRFVQQVYREEGEINLASGRHAKGVMVRGTAVRAHAPETHIRGCLGWMRAVLARPERGLHAELTQLRATNGAALVMAQVLARKQHVFVSGPGADDWRRLTAALDPAFRAVPAAIAQSDPLRADYLGRAARPTGFLAALQRLVTLELLPAETHALAQQILAARDPARLKALSEAQIVNAALLDELVERYERLVAQLCDALAGEAALGDVPQAFELLTQGAPLEALRERFGEFVMEERRAEVDIRDKRTLLNEVRLGLVNGEETLRERFERGLLRDVVRLRAVQDPRLYARVHRLEAMDAERLEALAQPRQWFVGWLRDGGAVPAGDAAALAPVPLRQGMFELIVNLTYASQFTKNHRTGTEPPPVRLARNLLSVVTLERFDVNRLRTLHPGVPARGVAANLAGKVPVTVAELRQVQAVLSDALFPAGRLAGALAQELHARHRSEARDRGTRERNAFLHGAQRLLEAMNYVVGHADGAPELRAAALAAGRALGLTMLESRDQIRGGSARSGAAHPGGAELRAEGYQLLMVRDDARWFPLRAPPAVLAGAYRHLYRERVARSVRAFVSKKLNYLHVRHGRGLFRAIHDHVSWSQGLWLSLDQLAGLLTRTRLFDAARLREFGYPSGAGDDAGANAWLEAALAGEEPAALASFTASQGEAACRAALKAFAELVRGYGPPGTTGGAEGGARAPWSLAETLAALAVEERYDLHDGAVRAALAGTREADALGNALRVLLAPHAEALAGALEQDAALELPLHGEAALLALLRERHALELGERTLQVRLLAAPGQAPAAGLPGQLAQALGKGMDAVVQRLARHEAAWRALVQAATLPLLDQMLQETVLRIVEPSGLKPEDLRGLPEGAVLCLGPSSHDQSRFGKLVARPDRRDAYATLSELASWLARFGRLREETAWYREVIADVREVIAGLNLSTFDAPYIQRYAEALGELDLALSLRPEELTAADLAEIERMAQALGAQVRSYYDQERTVSLRDRWMSRISMRLRAMHPAVRLTFVDALHEGPRAPPPEEPDAEAAEPEDAPDTGPARGRGDHQTFSERVRNVVEFRERMDAKRAFVLSPNNTQRQLTLAVIDQLYRLKGVHTPVFVDVSGCEDFLDALRTRIPPHRLFDLNAM